MMSDLVQALLDQLKRDADRLFEDARILAQHVEVPKKSAALEQFGKDVQAAATTLIKKLKAK